jgi:hypothetical protein
MDTPAKITSRFAQTLENEPIPIFFVFYSEETLCSAAHSGAEILLAETQVQPSQH